MMHLMVFSALYIVFYVAHLANLDQNSQDKQQVNPATSKPINAVAKPKDQQKNCEQVSFHETQA
jgi:hypothetical protein